MRTHLPFTIAVRSVTTTLFDGVAVCCTLPDVRDLRIPAGWYDVRAFYAAGALLDGNHGVSYRLPEFEGPLP